MTKRLLPYLIAIAMGSPLPLHAAVTYLGKGSIAGDDLDQSGLTGTVDWPAGSMPHNQVGGFGSAIAYTGNGNRFIATPDRGPGDGLVSTYFDRAYEMDIAVGCPSASCETGEWTVNAELAKTTLLTNEVNDNFDGNSSRFDIGLRFDPEGIRMAKNGASFFVSDEYGPSLYEFDRTSGNRIRAFDIPEKFLIDQPNADGTFELPPGNTKGRQSNRGMEGLAISPDGNKLYGIMQSPLIQDGGLNSSNNRRGVNTRILQLHVQSGDTQEFLYQLNSNRTDGLTSTLGISEIVAVNNHQFLVLERDGDTTITAFKKLFMIDLYGKDGAPFTADDATDISLVESLPQKLDAPLPAGVVPVYKTSTPFLDIVAELNAAGEAIPEKLEGLAFGKDFENGDKLLLITVDNDFISENPNTIYAFRIDKEDLHHYKPQIFAPKAKK